MNCPEDEAEPSLPYKLSPPGSSETMEKDFAPIFFNEMSADSSRRCGNQCCATNATRTSIMKLSAFHADEWPIEKIKKLSQFPDTSAFRRAFQPNNCEGSCDTSKELRAFLETERMIES